MNAERWRQIENLYHAALEHEPGQRGAFLKQACKGDEELRREVELLLAQDGSRSVLDDSTVRQFGGWGATRPLQDRSALG